MNDCIFCKIVLREIPNYTVYENDAVLAFLDIHPHAKGHTVVIPKVHVERASDMTVEGFGLFAEGVKRAMDCVQEVLSPDGVNVGWNDGKAAGQAVPHLHLHIFPRWHRDGGGSMHSIIENPGEMAVADVAKLFQKNG